MFLASSMCSCLLVVTGLVLFCTTTVLWKVNLVQEQRRPLRVCDSVFKKQIITDDIVYYSSVPSISLYVVIVFLFVDGRVK